MMLETLPLHVLIIAATILSVAYFIRGMAGFGSGLIGVPLLAFFLPLKIAVPMIVLLDYLASLSHGIKHRELIQWKEILPVLPFSILGVTLALYLLHNLDASLLKKFLGGFILLYAIYSLFSITPQRKASRWWAILAGSFGGLIGALFATGGPFYVIYLKLRGLNKSEFRATFALVFLLDGAARLSGFTLAGFYNRDLLLLILASVPFMAVGLYVGGHVHTSISQQRFQQMISILLIVSGIALLIK